MLEQDGSEDNPLYLEEKEGEIFSYYLNVFSINMGKGSNTQALVPTFKTCWYFCSFWAMLQDYCGKVKTEDLDMPLVQHVVKSAAVLVCVCDPLEAPVRFFLLGKPSPLTSDKQIHSAGTIRCPSAVL